MASTLVTGALANTTLIVVLGVPVVFGVSITLSVAGSTVLALPTTPGVMQGAWLSVSSTLLSTALALGMALLSLAKARAFWQRVLPAWLAIPHAAFAIGVLLLLSPNGWWLRLLSPEVTGWSRPPNWTWMPDPHALGLALGLALKEAPFLMLASVSALAGLRSDNIHRIGASLGYSDWQIWWRLMVPQIYAQLRLPLVLVLAYSVSVVDVALVLGPNAPAPLAVQAWRWLGSADSAQWSLGCAASLGVLLLAGGCIGLWRLGEWGVAALHRRASLNGQRHQRGASLWALSTVLQLGVVTGVLSVLLLWSFAWRWRFPASLPTQWSLRPWQNALQTGADVLANTVLIGLAVACLATLLAVLLLQGIARWRGWHGVLLYLPLLVPQLTFLYGVQIGWLRVGLDGSMAAVIATHTLFALPYAVLMLRGPWQGLDPRWMAQAASLGFSPWRVLLRVRLPLLLTPLCVAWAVAFGVSIAQYLSTQFAGAGRWPTLTTEAVALASGGDRRSLAVYALAQMLLPMLAFGLALIGPRWWQARRFKPVRLAKSSQFSSS